MIKGITQEGKDEKQLNLQQQQHQQSHQYLLQYQQQKLREPPRSSSAQITVNKHTATAITPKKYSTQQLLSHNQYSSSQHIVPKFSSIGSVAAAQGGSKSHKLRSPDPFPILNEIEASKQQQHFEEEYDASNRNKSINNTKRQQMFSFKQCSACYQCIQKVMKQIDSSINFTLPSHNTSGLNAKGNKVSRKCRLSLLLFFILAILPTLCFHIGLRAEMENLKNEMLSKSIPTNEDESSAFAIVSASLLQISLCFATLIVAEIFTYSANLRLSQHVSPVLIQLALQGFLPFVALKMPYYPLIYVNTILFLILTTLNVLFMTKSTLQYLIVFLALIIFLPIIYVYRQHKHSVNDVFIELKLDQAPDFLAPQSLSSLYLIHLYTVITVFFFLIIVVSRQMQYAKNALNELAKTQFDRLYEIIGLENEPYIVTKVVQSSQQHQSSTEPMTKTRSKQQEELGFKLTFISSEFQRQFLHKYAVTKIEDLIFRKVNLENMYEQTEPSERLQNEESTQKGAVGGLALKGRSRSFIQKKQQRETLKKVDMWSHKSTVLVNFKQLVDQWPFDSTEGQFVFEIKTSKQIKNEIQLKKEKLQQHQSQSQEVQQQRQPGMNGNNFQVEEEEKQQLLANNPQNINNLINNESSSLHGEFSHSHNGLQTFGAEKPQESAPSFKLSGMPILKLNLSKLNNQFQNNTNNGDRSISRSNNMNQSSKKDQHARLFVKVKIKQVLRAGQIYRIVHFKKISEPKQVARTYRPNYQDKSNAESNRSGSAHQEERFTSNLSSFMGHPDAKRDFEKIVALKQLSMQSSQYQLAKSDDNTHTIQKLIFKTKIAKLLMKLIPDQLTHLQSTIDSLDAINFVIQKLDQNIVQATPIKSKNLTIKNQNNNNIIGFVNGSNNNLGSGGSMNSSSMINSSLRSSSIFNSHKASESERVSFMIPPEESKAGNTNNVDISPLLQQKRKTLKSSQSLSYQSGVQSVVEHQQQNRLQFLLPQMESYIGSAKSSATILRQIFDTQLLFKRIFDRRQLTEMETYGGGPKQIAKETIEHMSHLLADLQIQVKVKSQVTGIDELIFPWRVYRSVLLHILLWSINLSRASGCIFVEISIEFVQDGEIGQKSKKSRYSSISKSHTSQTYSDSERGESEPASGSDADEGGQSFLQTCVYFEGVEEHLTDVDFQAAIRKDTNYLVSKRCTAYMGGKLTHLIDKKVVVIQVLLPLDEEIERAMQDVKHTDNTFWVSKYKSIYQLFRERLELTMKDLQTVDFACSEHTGKKSNNSKSGSTNALIGLTSTNQIQRQLSNRRLSLNGKHISYTMNKIKELSLEANQPLMPVRALSGNQATPMGFLNNFEESNAVPIDSEEVIAPSQVQFQLKETNTQQPSSVQDNNNSRQPPEEKKSETLLVSDVESATDSKSNRPKAPLKFKSHQPRPRRQPDMSWREEIEKSLAELNKEKKQSPKHPQRQQQESNSNNKNPFRKCATFNKASKRFDQLDVEQQPKKVLTDKQPLRRLKTIKEENKEAMQDDSLEIDNSLEFDDVIEDNEDLASLNDDRQQDEEDQKLDDPDVHETSYTVSIDMGSDQIDEGEHYMNDDKYYQPIRPVSKEMNPLAVDQFEEMQKRKRKKNRGSQLKSENQQKVIRSKNKFQNEKNPPNKRIISSQNQRPKSKNNILHNHNHNLEEGKGGELDSADDNDQAGEGREGRLKMYIGSHAKSLSVGKQSIDVRKPAQSQQSDQDVSNDDSEANSQKEGENNKLNQSMLQYSSDEKQKSSSSKSSLEMKGHPGGNNSKQQLHRQKELSAPNLQLLSNRSNRNQNGIEERKQGKNSSSDAAVADDKEILDDLDQMVAKSQRSQSAEQQQRQGQAICNCVDSCLVIDDQHYTNIPIKMQLKKLFNINLVTCENGMHGLQRYSMDIKKNCCQKYFHFILLDHNSFQENGMVWASKIYQIYEKVQIMNRYKHVPSPQIIAVTNLTVDKELIIKAEQNHIFQLLHKPVDNKTLLSAIKKNLSKKVLRDIQILI